MSFAVAVAIATFAGVGLCALIAFVDWLRHRDDDPVDWDNYNGQVFDVFEARPPCGSRPGRPL